MDIATRIGYMMHRFQHIIRDYCPTEAIKQECLKQFEGITLNEIIEETWKEK